MKATLHCVSVTQSERVDFDEDTGDAIRIVYEMVTFRIDEAPWSEYYERGSVTVHVSKQSMLGTFKVGRDYEMDLLLAPLPL